MVYLNANIRSICTQSPENKLNCKFQNINYQENSYAFQDGGIGRYLLSMALMIPILFGFLAIIEYEMTTGKIRYFLQRIKCCKNKVDKKGFDRLVEDIDTDVLKTKKFIESNKSELIPKNPLVVDRLSKGKSFVSLKFYSRGNFLGIELNNVLK